jgi:hypothetical protein
MEHPYSCFDVFESLDIKHFFRVVNYEQLTVTGSANIMQMASTTMAKILLF